MRDKGRGGRSCIEAKERGRDNNKFSRQGIGERYMEGKRRMQQDGEGKIKKEKKK